jgi:hypothetical protein
MLLLCFQLTHTALKASDQQRIQLLLLLLLVCIPAAECLRQVPRHINQSSSNT